jgi:N6-adenosine-specific RNA methylase IME4
MTCPLANLQRRHYRVVVIDPPWRWAGGTKGRPQHYPRMTFDEIAAMPVRDLLHPEGARVFLWITAPLLNRVDDLRKAWRLRYSSAIPWVKLWPSESGMFVYRTSVARGTGLEVMGNAEYAVILKTGKPQSIKGKPFPGVYLANRREHSRKPVDLLADIEQRLSGPYCEVFSREHREGWDAAGNEVGKFNGVAA